MKSQVGDKTHKHQDDGVQQNAAQADDQENTNRRSTVTDGRGAVGLTPVPANPLEKGRGGVPMSPPPPPPVPAKPPAPVKKK